MNAPEMARVYGYIRASTDKQIASPETQRQIIEDYAKRLGRTVDRYFIDPAVSGKKSLFDREAGKELLARSSRRATRSSWPVSIVSAARFIGFARILEFWLKHKITMHLCDMPGGVFDPDNPMSEMLIGMLIVFANYERRLISVRTREGLQARKQRGEKYCRWAGVRLALGEAPRPAAARSTSTSRSPTRASGPSWRKCVELRAAGHSLDKIRQHLNYEMKVRTRLGGQWTTRPDRLPGSSRGCDSWPRP